MDSSHFIRDFNLDIAFASEQEALVGASRLSSFASERLIAVAHEVFNRFNLAGGVVLSIDSLECDLGDLPARGCYEEAETRFRRWLEERIALEVYRNRSLPGETAHASAWLVPAAQRDLDLVVYWLENGYLPWNAPRLDLPALRRLLDRVVWEQGEQLASRLRAVAYPRAVACRLAWHSSGKLEQRITDLLQSLGGDEDSADANVEESVRQSWESRLLGLLESPEDPIDVPGAIRQAILTGDPNPSGASLPRLVRRYPDVVAALVRTEGTRPEVLHAMAEGFDDQLLGQIVQALEPVEGRFVLAATRQPALYGQAARPHTYSAEQTRAMVWEFALAYLIVDRGGEFNRRSLLRSIVRRMAAHCNRDYGSLVLSLYEVSRSAAAHSPEHRGVLLVFDELRRDGLASAHTQDDSDENESAESGSQPTETATSPDQGPRTSESIGTDPSEYGPPDLMRRIGADPHLRNLVARRIPLPLLLDVVDEFDAAASGHRKFIRDLAGAFEAIVGSLSEWPSNGGELVGLLWDVTLDHLARGNFDRSRYLQGALNRFAGKYDIEPRQLLYAIERSVSMYETAGESQEEILVLVRQLRQNGYGTVSGDAVGLWIAKFEAALLRADRESIATLWQSWPEAEVSAVLTLFRQLAASPAQRRRLLAALPNEVAREAVEAASPRDLPIMLRIAELVDTLLLREVLPRDADSTRGIVWSCLLIDASRRCGAAFEERACLDAVLRGLAEHCNLRYGDLLSEIHRLSEDSALAARVPPAFWSFVAEQRDACSSRDRERSAAAYAASSIERLQESYALYDAVMRWATRSDQSESNELTALLSRLRAESPLTWRRIVREGEPWSQPASSTPSSLRPVPSPIFVEGSGWAIAWPPIAVSESSAQAVSGAEPGKEARYTLIRDRKMRGPLPDAIAAILDVTAIGTEDSVNDDPVVDPLMDLMGDSRTVRALTRLLPERRLVTLVLSRAPRGFERQIAMAEAIAEAADLRDHGLLWEFLIDQSQSAEAATPDATFVGELIQRLARQRKTSPAELRETTIRRIRQYSEPAAREDSERTLAALEQARGQAPSQDARSTAASRPVARGRRVRQSHAEPIFVANAGLVLAGHYLPRLFDAAGLFEAGRFKHEEAVHRGVYLLQYLADGSIDAPEHLLPLNKILCGLEPEEPITTRKLLTPSETEVADGLLEAILAHWPALGRTSVQGLRESFLQREGRLSIAPPAWQLLVEPRPFDMLLDRLPWSFNVIKHQWMDKALFVEWR